MLFYSARFKELCNHYLIYEVGVLGEYKAGLDNIMEIMNIDAPLEDVKEKCLEHLMKEQKKKN